MPDATTGRDAMTAPIVDAGEEEPEIEASSDGPTLPLSPCQGTYFCDYSGILSTTLSPSGDSCIWTWTGSAPEAFTLDSGGDVYTISSGVLLNLGTWSGTAARFTVTAPFFAITPGQSDTITCYGEAADQ